MNLNNIEKAKIVKIAKRLNKNNESIIALFCQKHELEDSQDHILTCLDTLADENFYELDEEQSIKAMNLIKSEEQFNYDTANDEILSIHERNLRLIHCLVTI